jgi:hypothetical protein
VQEIPRKSLLSLFIVSFKNTEADSSLTLRSTYSTNRNECRRIIMNAVIRACVVPDPSLL